MVTLRRRRRTPSPVALSVFVVGALLLGACQEPPTTGKLSVNIAGLPTGANGAVRIVGPNQFFQMVRQTTILENLAPGDYFVTRDTVIVAQTRYGVAAVLDTITIVRGRTESMDVSYGVASGALTLTIAGLPNGTPASIILRGPLTPSGSLAFNEGVIETRTIMGLRPGSYEIVSDTTHTILGDKFATLKRLDTIAVPASVTPVSRSVQYNLVSGALSLTVTGLPISFSGQPVTVTGPGGYVRTTSQTTTFRGLLAGTYSIAAANVNNTCPDVYSTQNSQQTVDVITGETAAASVAYTAQQVNPAALNLRVEKVYLTQATQNPQGSVPMISGKPALLRVFGIANQCNTAKPQVRLTLSGGVPISLDGTEDSVRMLLDDGVLASSWNYVVPANLVQPGLTVVAEIDPTNAVAEANNGDNRFPASGSFSPDIRPAPVVGLRFVPIHQSANTLTGNVTTGNVDQFLEWPRKLHPVGTYDVDIRSTYTTSVAALTANGSSGWSSILSEIRALRLADSSATPTARYYYGVVKVSYGAGIAGIAYVPGKTGMGWDYLPSGSRIMAHEMGHNFGRLHSPCGGPAGVDGGYPYDNGGIGVSGWDPIEGFKVAGQFTDVMGYCNSQWISDYTYVGMFNYVSGQSSLPGVSSGAEQSSLLVWGRIVNGQPILEPAFEMSARATAPTPGPHRVSFIGADGAEVFGVSFAGERIADLSDEIETFAFTVPLSALRGRAAASLKLTTRRGTTATSVASGDVGADPAVSITRPSSRMARIRWDATRFPVVMVRDPANGQIISFARGGDATIVTNRTQLDLSFSNRVRSTRRLKEFK